MPKMPGGDEKKEESAESKEEAAEQVIRIRQPGGVPHRIRILN
jgi:hypothetical protein